MPQRGGKRSGVSPRSQPRPQSGQRRRQSQDISKSDQSLSPICGLPDDVLYSIFSKCTLQSLGRLCRVSHRFNRLLQSDSAWLTHSKQFQLVQADVTINVSQKTSLKEQCRVSLNWVNKEYKERVILRHSPKQLPWMQYSDETLWISTKNTIRCYSTKVGGQVSENKKRELVLPTDADVSRFVIKQGHAVSGCRDGSLFVFNSDTGRCIMECPTVHDTDTQTVDFHDSCIISGSRDHTMKVLKFPVDCEEDDPVRATVQVGDRVWSSAIALDGRSFAVGTAGVLTDRCLSVWDIERCELIHAPGQHRHGAGVLDMKYETQDILLTCGYDSTLKMWDMRSGQCVLQWEEPFDTTLYCIQSDRNVTMVTGTARYSMLRLWDKRQTQPVQLYYLGLKKSPVYSVVFDSSRLYAALDLSVTQADFSVLPT